MVFHERSGSGFDGAAGLVAARVMARVNRDAEYEAANRLAPVAGARLLVVGFGPGLGVERLAADGATFVGGVDPSGVMLRAATRRNADAVAAGRVELLRAT